MRTQHPDYVVIRAAPGLLSPEVNGKWFHRATLQRTITLGAAVAVPTGRFEIRQKDGAVAEVYEVRL